MRRVLHIFSSFDFGGAEARTLYLMEQIGRDVAHVIWIGVPDHQQARSQIDPSLSVSVDEAASRLVLGRPSWRRFRAMAQAMRGYDLILTYSWGANDAVMAHGLFARRMGLGPLIHHKDGYDANPLKLGERVRSIYRRIALRQAEALVVPSITLEQAALIQQWIPHERLFRITNGIDVAAYAHPPRAVDYPGFRQSPDEVVIGTVAGLRAVKNLPRLVRAFAHARAQSSVPLRLVIVGSGDQHSIIEEEVRRLDVAAHVHLAGFLPHADRYIGLFDLFALSSNSEQQPIVVMEAMAASLPIVSTDVGDVKAMVTKQNGLFVVDQHDESALAQAMITLANDPSLRSAIGDANQARAATLFDKRIMVSAYRSLYARAMRCGQDCGSASGDSSAPASTG